MKFFLLLTFAILPLVGLSQVEDEDIDFSSPPPKRGYRHNIIFDVHAPHLVSNEAIARAYTGIAGGKVAYHVRLFKNFSLGISVRVLGYEFYSPSFRDTGANNYNIQSFVGLSLMYEVKLANRVVYIPNVDVGYGWIRYMKIRTPSGYLNDHGFSVQLNNGLYYYVRRDEKVGIGIIFGANYFTHEFNLQKTGLEGDGNLSGAKDSGPTVNLNIGFGVIARFGRVN